ncbi:MAG TPA: phosphatase PAP2 family protein [Deltaproteobacteria bacterium]|nr:phosphatase PAP2 family protein [Deltaproteobacteria bacterium]HOI06735.1 phosphatase PAP2 family protein [Deltaproteobacteria bacterium]
MRFAGYRLSPGSYLGLHLAVGLVLSIFFVWLFLEIAEGVLTNEEIVAIDYWVSAHVLYLRSSFTNTLMICATNLGGVAFVLSAGSLIVGFLLVKGHPDKAAGFAAAILGGQLLNVLLKIIIQRQRPTDINALVHAGGWSFPSGHAMMSTVFYGMAAYFLVRSTGSWRMRVAWVALSGFMMLLIGLSRVYLHVHYLSDVLAGFAAGLFWLTVCITGLNAYEMRRSAVRGTTVQIKDTPAP